MHNPGEYSHDTRTLCFALCCHSDQHFHRIVRAGGSTALPFLLISPSAETNGLGDASVAVVSSDPFAPMANPALLGVFNQSNFLTLGRNIVNPWLPSFDMHDLWYRTYAVDAGVRLDSLRYTDLPLSIGFSYSNIMMNLGEFIPTTEYGPEGTASFDAYETSNQATLSVGYDYGVHIAVGLTYRRVEDHLSPVGAADGASGYAQANLYDLGAFVGIPALQLLAGNAANLQLPSGLLSPRAGINAGFVANNLGQHSISYSTLQGDPAPRRARIGIALDGGLQFVGRGTRWELFSCLWTIEAADPLVNRNRTSWSYQSFPGDIDIVHEVILGKTNSKTTKSRGWKIDGAELVSIFGGHFEESIPMGGRNFTTRGFSVQSQGISKILSVLGYSLPEESFARYVLGHLNLKYSESDISTVDSYSPLAGTKYSSFDIFLTY